MDIYEKRETEQATLVTVDICHLAKKKSLLLRIPASSFVPHQSHS